MRGARSSMLVALLCAALAATLVLMVGCGDSGGGDPETVTREFLNALIAHDAPGSYALLSLKFQGEWGVTAITWNGAMMKNPIPETASYSVKGQDIQGDSASVTITPAGGADEQVKLVKEDGEWLIDYELGQWYGLE